MRRRSILFIFQWRVLKFILNIIIGTTDYDNVSNKNTVIIIMSCFISSICLFRAKFKKNEFRQLGTGKMIRVMLSR